MMNNSRPCKSLRQNSAATGTTASSGDSKTYKGYFFALPYDTGGGEEFINRLSERLVALRDARLLKRLWKAVITIRTERFWLSRRYNGGTPAELENELTAKRHAIEAMTTFAGILKSLDDLDSQSAYEELERLKANRKPKRVGEADTPS